MQQLFMKIISPQFEDGGVIPCKYTCNGSGINPSLEFVDVPKSTRSLTLIFEDPDIPRKFSKGDSWVHWIVWNIYPGTRHIRENDKYLGAIVGKNTSGYVGYEGPCPSRRKRQYYYKLFALDTKLDIPSESHKEAVLRAMKGHVLAKAELMGTYEHKYHEPM
jgi:Raf kinase inhibitor-like YbhB/YbcL family protein